MIVAVRVVVVGMHGWIAERNGIWIGLSHAAAARSERRGLQDGCDTACIKSPVR
jgi:hypothetical protein